jgi:two-component system sensor histidine kinase KdpD
LIASVYRHVRRNLVILFVLLSTLVIDVLVLYLLDQKFNAVKRDELIQDDAYDSQIRSAFNACVNGLRAIRIETETENVSVPFVSLVPTGGVYSATMGNKVYTFLLSLPAEALHDTIAAELRKAITGDNIFFRAAFYPLTEVSPRVTANEAAVTVEDLGKWRRANTYSNNLFTRSFENLVRYRLGDVGSIALYYTSPTDAAWMPDLLARYRVYSALVIAFAIFTFLVMLRKVLLPLKRVATGLDAMQRNEVSLIEDPWSGIEIVYNSLARNTMVMQFDRRLAEVASAAPETPEERYDPAEPLIREIPPIMVETFVFKTVYFLRFDDIEQRLTVSAGGGDSDPANVGRYFDTSEAMLKKMFAERTVLLVAGQKRENVGYSLDVDPPYVLSAVICDQRHFGVLIIKGPENSPIEEAGFPFVEAITRVVENTILKVAARQLMIDREKNEISINLSTNMGHDLTNIIATSKWDIETVKRAWDRGLVRFTGDDAKKRYFEEAIAGLLNNTRMLQEIVNIYRAFGFAKKPQYEWTDIGFLIEDVSKLYKVSTSQQVEIQSRIEPDLPSFWVEPRLLQLAVFNLMSNAAQATARRHEEESQSGKLCNIEVQAWAENSNLKIAVRDEGTGFRDSDGDLLSGRELERIFRYGYSTKKDNVGGGLGLSWVEAIIKDFHDGSIEPRNRPEGGAEMRIIIPEKKPSAPGDSFEAG